MPEEITPEYAESRVIETQFVRIHERILACVKTLDDGQLFVGASITPATIEYDEEASRTEANADAFAKVILTLQNQ